VAKAARFDFPASWPGLLTDLLAAAGGAAALGAGATASSADALRGRRTCLALHYVTKELASKRLAADQRAFAQVTTLLFEPVWQGWCSLLDQLLVALPAALAAQHPPPPELPAAFERWLLLLKVQWGQLPRHETNHPIAHAASSSNSMCTIHAMHCLSSPLFTWPIPPCSPA
jgi:hypothetical protein